jgi:hypothetical protein
VKDVTVINVATKEESPAKAGDVLVPPNVLKTGPDSRAELIAEDKTVTRVGSNTIFSVEADSRDVNIAQGSVLFNSPKGKGGGRIKSAGATASVLGTTLIVGANQAGGFKVMLLEGKGQVTGAKGGAAKLSPGQMSFAMPGKPPTAPLNFELKGNVANSKLVGGFSKPLASIAKIEAAVNVQQAKIASGALETTGLVIGDQPGVAIVVDSTVLTNMVAKAASEIKAVAKAVAVAKEKIAQKLLEQEKANETKTPRGDEPDPRFLDALAKNLSLRTSFAPEDSIFSIDGSGASKVGYMIAKNVPQSQTQSGNPDISTLIANNIDLKLSPVESSTAEIFLHSPVEIKDGSAIVALKDLKISGSIDFTGFDNVRTFPTLHGIPVFPGATDAVIKKGEYTVIQLASSFGLEKGFAVTGEGIPAGTYIKDVDYTKNTITLSQQATLADSSSSSSTIPATLQVTATDKSATVVLSSDTPNFDTLSAQLATGMKVSSEYFLSGTFIKDIAITYSSDGTTGKTVTLTLSQPATGSGSTQLKPEQTTGSFTVFSSVPVSATAASTEVVLSKTTPNFDALYKQLVVGMKVSNEYFPSGTVVKAITDNAAKNTVTITLTQPATGSGSTQLSLGGQPIDISGLLQVDAVRGSAVVDIKVKTDSGFAAAPTVGLLVGMTVRSEYFPDGTVIQSIGDNGKITLSKAALTKTPTSPDEVVDNALKGIDLALGGIQSGTPLILSAGHQFILEPGSLIRTATSLLDIYAAGTEFAADLTLAAQVNSVKAPLKLDRVSIENEWPLDASTAAGALRITAPKIEILDSRIRAADIKIESFAGDLNISTSGDLNVSTRSVRGKITTEGNFSKITLTNESDISQLAVGQRIYADGLAEGTKIDAIEGRVITLSKKAIADSETPLKVLTPLPLGITDIDSLAIDSYALSLKSAGKLSIGNVPLYTVNATFEAGDAISLKGVDIRFSDFQQDQTLSILAKTGDLTIESSYIDDTKVKNTKAPALVTTTFTANEGNVTLTDVELGSVLDVKDVEEKTHLKVISKKANLVIQALTNQYMSLYADAMLLDAKGGVNILGNIKNDPDSPKPDGSDVSVTIGPTDSTQGSLDIFARTGSVKLFNTDLKHYEVNITAGGDLVGQSLAPTDAKVRAIDLNHVTAVNASRVALDATTIILKDVTFKARSDVYLNSYYGMVAAWPGYEKVNGQTKEKVPGMVNFMSNVSYGAIPIVISSDKPMNPLEFKAAAEKLVNSDSAGGYNASKIRIGTQTGNATTVGK